ncbi:hypothetical protein SAMN04515648_2224 [Phyllobacterium sp. CL33Tsu]|uniref:hypothetical protein n=1 Tax=Phyllobacterium TaxID=28100 RepID=UPI0008E9DC07|nr:MULTISPECIES: hypothetical protein [unclassified Phyllobacterium]UGY08969.1 hypothetical protein LLE51_013185 [Phyllobacterium sp. T1018]SFI97015.1 hypothetical protein SAMN04515648_2224 [Phyllobacterium sp. CL33Tsu]
MSIILGLVFSRQEKIKSSKQRPSAKDLARKFCLLARKEPTLGPLAVITAEGDDGKARSSCSILPTDEDVHFYQDGAQVNFSAATVATGPGYHDYLVALLDELVEQEKLVVTQDEEFSDDTQYWTDRNYDVLQTHMSVYFNSVSKVVVERSRASKHGPLSLSLSAQEALDVFKDRIMTVRGPRDVDFFGFKGEAANFFPWWDFGLPARAAFGLAEAMLWRSFPWRGPIDQYEALFIQVLSELIKIAREEPRLETDKKLNVAAFEAASRSKTWPRPPGMGYLRYPRPQPFGDNWWITLPGHFILGWDDRFKQNVFKSIGCIVVPAATTIEHDDRRPPEGFTGKLDVSVVKDKLSFYGIWNYNKQEDGKTDQWLEGCAVARDGVTYLFILMDDPGLKQWAVDTLLSIEHR